MKKKKNQMKNNTNKKIKIDGENLCINCQENKREKNSEFCSKKCELESEEKNYVEFMNALRKDELLPWNQYNTKNLKKYEFYEKNEKGYEFTNFYDKAPFEIDGIEWKTSEHYFQAMKYENVEVVDWICENNLFNVNQLHESYCPLTNKHNNDDKEKVEIIKCYLASDREYFKEENVTAETVYKNKNGFELPATDKFSFYHAKTFTYKGKTFRSIYHAFVSLCFPFKLSHLVSCLATPRDCFEFVRDPIFNKFCDPQWHSNQGDQPKRVKVMKKAVLEKFSQNKQVGQLLIDTQNCLLIEHTKNDKYWADAGDGSGLNMLGKILMQTRETLKAKNDNRNSPN